MVSRTPDYVVCLGYGIYVTKCKEELGFLWKFNVVLASCGLKTLKRRRRLVGSRERDQSDLTS